MSLQDTLEVARQAVIWQTTHPRLRINSTAHNEMLMALYNQNATIITLLTGILEYLASQEASYPLPIEEDQ